MQNIDTLYSRVEQRVRQLRYRDRILAILKKAQLTPQVSADLHLKNLRIALEEFLKETAHLAPRFKSVTFLGNWNAPYAVRDFIKDRGWLSVNEHKFLNSFYGLLSQGAAHEGEFRLDMAVATCICWGIFDLLSARVASQPPRNKHADDRKRLDSAAQLALVRNFLRGLRKREYAGPGFDIDFDWELMKLARSEVRLSDSPHLMKLLSDPTAKSGLRNRAASLILVPRMADDQRSMIVKELIKYYHRCFNISDWQIFRAIALALSNRLNYDQCILHYLREIRRDRELINKNLKLTDDFYETSELAVERYLSRLNNLDIPTGGCIWELFYVGRRAKRQDENILEILSRRFDGPINQEIGALYDEAIRRLTNRKQP